MTLIPRRGFSKSKLSFQGTYFAIFSAFLFMGMSQTALAPANEALLEKWLPPDEKEYFNWLIYGGKDIKTLLDVEILLK